MHLVVFALLTFVVTGSLVIERYLHARNRARIPTIIHVNGTRGKSSVTRLIAAGLREGGTRTWAKVTGTLPMLIDVDGRDVPIARSGPASINEQRTLIAAASAAGVDALVLECMALQPEYQRVSEDGLVQATIGVITNVRPDHLEVFGADPRAMINAFRSTIPRGKLLFTAERRLARVLKAEAVHRNATFVQTRDDSVDDATMSRFRYYEHKENVALALAVCGQLGVSQDVALRGMLRCQPDAGALTPLVLRRAGKELVLINAMAANDPESTHQLYRELVLNDARSSQCLVVANARRDRPGRTEQLAALLPRLAADHFYLVGDGATGLRDLATTKGVDAARMSVHLGATGDLVGVLFSRVQDSATVFAIGNIAGPGLALANYFEVDGEPVLLQASPAAPIQIHPELLELTA